MVACLDRFVPKYFEKDIQSGVPTLTQAGREALEEEVKFEDEDDAGGERGGSALAPVSIKV
jgi:hypothetical protein